MRWIFLGLWIALVGEAVWFSPEPRADQGAWIWALLTGDWAGEEPMVVALFMLMGMWPFALAAVLAPRLRRRPVPLWPFVLGSMAFGAYTLLPGLILGGATVQPAPWQRWLRSRWLLAPLAVASLALVTWGATSGHVDGFLQAFSTEQLVHLMSLDFVVLWLTSILAAWAQGGRWWVTVVPILGALVWAGGER